jgi:hypothetical protein
MDLNLAKRIESDEDFKKKITKLVKDYVQLGSNSLQYWTDEFDAAHDILMCYAPLTKADLENLEKGHPKRFVLPVTATQITTMTTFISQVLFGDEVPHKVEPRGPEDEVGAEHMNQLLRWNAEQQPTYLLGYLWVQDALTYNRGIFYNAWESVFETRVELEDAAVLNEFDEEGNPVTYEKVKKVKVPVGGFNKMHLVSPYDFLTDPALPLWRLQDMRFCGHRTLVPWNDLKRRSELPADDPAYILPSAVEALKEKKKKSGSGAAVPTKSPSAPNAATMSRTAYERGRMEGNPQQDADKEDPGMVELHEVYIRLVPKDRDLDESDSPTIYQFCLANQDTLLSVNDSPLQHEMYPYSVGESRPSGYYQFSPGWVMHMKALQDYIDYFKNRRQQAITRTLGNIFIARTDCVNLTDFLDPDKEGLIIPVLPDAAADKLDDIIKQVQVNDSTKEFHKEMADFVDFSEQVSGVNSQMQGQTEGDGTATEFVSAQQMGAGRLTAIARLLSVQGLVSQTKQFVANFQQFLSLPMSIRFVGGNRLDIPALLSGQRALEITPDVIQGRFDYIAHDGSLPGTDNKKVAAISRLLEVAPAFPQFFTPAPGNIDGRALLLSAAKAAGLNVENFQYKASDMPQPAPAPQSVPQGTPQQPGALPDLGGLPVDTAGPGRPPTPDALNVPSASPLEIRPNQL